jgi:DNA modification methylase
MPKEPFWTDDAVTIWNADALALPLPDESVDLIVTSPPYFGLRSYTDGGEHYDGQIGSEPTPGEFVDAVIAATAEMTRTLKPSGSIWVNLGDKYGPGKSLLGLPWRYALRCVDDLGLVLRAEVIWSKPNGLPESVTDRVRRSHEQWFHFTKESRYFSAVDEIREPHAPESAARYAAGFKPTKRTVGEDGMSTRGIFDGEPSAPNPLGKMPGSVWDVPTQPLKVPARLGIDHFAAFPMEWPRRLIRGWSPSGICVECGEGRRPTSERTLTVNRKGRQSHRGISAVDGGDVGSLGWEREVAITGYACACDDPTAPTRPAVVLDPFGGTGTTALVAKALGRTGWHVDLSADYCRLAQWRINDPGELARAMQVEKPPAAPEDMDSLLDLLEDGAA